ncbi:membrane protein insertase YidC [Bacteriovorax sp. Seq25_V]|uniref:membrane protein insertase YidC n=1 Tax=Bacteriovorax sp. Seq25_V TaxID=1201288 RepID=UPI00038A007A|nr:membrane protein insertase YidC [Bacteriovorax sp. Seq25_V]EQC43341.1 60Kd inner membrane protein [Bacteriovorax sp. Seq25_V]
MNNDQKRTVLAFTISGLILFAWNAFFMPKTDKAIEEKVISDNNISRPVSEQKTTSVINNESKAQEVPTQLTEVTSVNLINGDYAFTVNSDFSFASAKGNQTGIALNELSDEENFFRLLVVNSKNQLENISLKFEEIAMSSTIAGYDEHLGLKVTFDLKDDGRLFYKIEGNTASNYAFSMQSSEKSQASGVGRQFLINTTDTQRINVGSDDDGEGKTKWVGLDFNHHLFAQVFSEKLVSKFAVKESGYFVLRTIEPTNTLEGYFIYSLKNYDYLSSFKDQLDLSIDFGLFSVLAVPILKGMQYIYNYVGNFGLAIIILTFIIRFLTFPLQFKSFKSMKKMQTVQPEIAKLKEKFKDDPQRMQKETMELFKRAGANPLGGCLPMLLQVPIFIAFYQAINNSVDLVNAPFILWITDLSMKDPYYVLPVLMGITMLMQTKLNPSTTADPNQQKIMYIMPLVFCFIMKDLPAGLNLYFCVSNLLGIGQQLLVYKTID